MSDYANLRARIEGCEVIILDGAIGTQLQRMEVPMSHDAWAAIALETHPFTVRRLHELYIEAGVDVITTNTYSSARHNLLPLGLGDKVHELNLRAVMLAEDARDRLAKERAVWIGGSVSNYGLMAGAEPGWKDFQYFRGRVETSENQARANLREQADILAESGVDFLIAEPTGSTVQRRWVIEACLATGLPVWSGFKCRRDSADGSLKVGYQSDEAFDAEFASLAALGGEVVTVFHSPVDATDDALAVVKAHWNGPIGIYPEAERTDYVDAHRDESVETKLTPDEFLARAQRWVSEGVQVVGGCCGVELEYIRPLRDGLPERVAG
ncbi:MAG: homocysteine S-methyltransferase family protein [Gammaproteobacteria bacterium]|nr:homocysteine S-methyltransferase family protein [Gammaproteobacteria bacterium]